MRETKAQLLTRKNSELWCIQARIRGIRADLIPLSKMSNASTATKEIIDLCDIAINQIDNLTKEPKLMKTRKGYQFAVRDFKNWSVRNPQDQIMLMAGNQARLALQAIYEGKLLKTAICLAYSFPPELS